jgi:predicted DNA-binding transcriptional regulator AlpA
MPSANFIEIESAPLLDAILHLVHVAPTHIKGSRDMATSSETYGAMPATGYMRQSQLIPAIFPFSSATLWRKVKAGTFPKPVKLGPRITAWRVEDIREMLQRGA